MNITREILSQVAKQKTKMAIQNELSN